MTENKKPILMFDWDGTVVNNNQYKLHDAWVLTFEGEPEKQEKIVEVLQGPEGRLLYRYALVARVIEDEEGNEDLKGVKNTDDWIRTDPRVMKYTDVFAKLVMDHSKMPPFEKTQETLKSLNDRGYTMYVVSGASVEMIEAQIELYEIDYFKKVFGNFDSKPNHQKAIAEIEGTDDPKDFISIGDGQVDQVFAEKVGCRFIGISNKWNNWKADEEDFEVIEDIGGLVEILK